VTILDKPGMRHSALPLLAGLACALAMAGEDQVPSASVVRIGAGFARAPHCTQQRAHTAARATVT